MGDKCGYKKTVVRLSTNKQYCKMSIIGEQAQSVEMSFM